MMYEDVQDTISKMPITMLPGILDTVIHACIKEGVFVEPDGLTMFVAQAKGRAMDNIERELIIKNKETQ